MGERGQHMRVAQYLTDHFTRMSWRGTLDRQEVTRGKGEITTKHTTMWAMVDESARRGVGDVVSGVVVLGLWLWGCNFWFSGLGL